MATNIGDRATHDNVPGMPIGARVWWELEDNDTGMAVKERANRWRRTDGWVDHEILTDDEVGADDDGFQAFVAFLPAGS
jgi:hypothetical protein